MTTTLADEFQKAVMRTANKALSKDGAILNTALGLAGESGEYIELIKKAVYHGHTLDLDKCRKELGDVLYYAAWAAEMHGFKLSEVMDGVIEKLKIRYPDGFSSEASVNRPGKEL